MRYAGYRVRWQGEEYAASPQWRTDGLWLRLRRSEPADGFEAVTEELFVQPVPVADCTAVTFVSTVCQWRGASCLVLGERDAEVLLEYAGGSAPAARTLGLERIERGVYRGWVPREDVRGWRENTELLR